eukprot:scaffold26098_cov32-Tisochrysis_lutea.AAC.4
MACLCNDSNSLTLCSASLLDPTFITMGPTVSIPSGHSTSDGSCVTPTSRAKAAAAFAASMPPST